MSYLAVSSVANAQKDWEWIPLRRLARIRREANSDSSSVLLALSSDRGVEPRADDGGRQLPSESTVEGYWRVYPGDLVFNPMWAIGGGVAVSAIHGAVSTAYRIYAPGPRIWPRFLHYWLRSEPAVRQYKLMVRGITTFDRAVTREDLEGMPIPIPGIAVQRAIADYLDRDTARIDALIAAKRRMMDLLEEHLRVAISDTTAEGHSTAVRRIIVLRTTGPRGWGDLVAEIGEPFIRSANLRRDDIELQADDIAMVAPPPSKEATRSRTRPGDVLVGVTGANTGWVGIVRRDFAHGYVSQHVAILRPASDLLPEWLAYSLFSNRVQDQLLGGQYGGTKQQLGLEDLAELVIRVPDLDRQNFLIARLERAKDVCQNAIAALSAQIELLQERRQALITAAVTGQLGILEAA